MKNKVWIGIAVGGVSIAGLSTAIAVSNTTYLAQEVHICEIDDLHGKVPGWGDDFFKPATNQAGCIRLSQEIQRIVNQYPGSIVLTGGDQNSSGPFSTCTQGDTMYPVLKAMDIRYSAVGNHAWDFGGDKLTSKHFDELGRTSSTVDNYFVTSNVLNDKSLQEHNWVYHESEQGFADDFALWYKQKVSWADPYKLIDMSGHKIAFIGLTTQDTMTDGCQSELTNTCFIDYLPAISYTKYLMKQDLGDTQFNRIEAFVLYTHIGASYDSATQTYGGEAVKLAKDVEDQVDLILGAHSHQDIATFIHNDKLNKDIPVLEARAHGESFADAALIFDNTKQEGKRLKEIKIQDIQFTIPESRAEAFKQIEAIRANPVNSVVTNTIKVYDEQKEKAKEILDKTLATSKNGLTYDLEWGWHEGYNVIEPAGAFVAKGNIKGFELFYKTEVEEQKVYKPSISIISKDSIQQQVDAGNVKTRDVYGLIPFDNKPAYFTLTYHQLEQTINYILSGADKDKAKGKHNTDTYYYDDEHTKPVSPFEELRFTYGPSQFYGFKFDCVKLAEPDEQARRHQYKPDSLRIYDPENSQHSIDDPSTWGDKTYWGTRLFGCEMSNFNFNGGNNQFLMIGAFAKYNAEQYPQDPRAQIHNSYIDDCRNLLISYLEWLGSQQPEMTADLDDSVLKQLFHIVE